MLNRYPLAWLYVSLPTATVTVDAEGLTVRQREMVLEGEEEEVVVEERGRWYKGG